MVTKYEKYMPKIKIFQKVNLPVLLQRILIKIYRRRQVWIGPKLVIKDKIVTVAIVRPLEFFRISTKLVFKLTAESFIEIIEILKKINLNMTFTEINLVGLFCMKGKKTSRQNY